MLLFWKHKNCRTNQVQAHSSKAINKPFLSISWLSQVFSVVMEDWPTQTCYAGFCIYPSFHLVCKRFEFYSMWLTTRLWLASISKTYDNGFCKLSETAHDTLMLLTPRWETECHQWLKYDVESWTESWELIRPSQAEMWKVQHFKRRNIVRLPSDNSFQFGSILFLKRLKARSPGLFYLDVWHLLLPSSKTAHKIFSILDSTNLLASFIDGKVLEPLTLHFW